MTKRQFTKTWARVRRWLKVMKGPPPRKHGVIPYDHEPIGLPASQRPYLHDYSLMLRPGKAYSPLTEHDYDRVGWRVTPLENPLGLYD